MVIVSESMEEIIDPNHTRRDLRMLESVITNGWDIPAVLMKQLPIQMAKIVAEGSRREAIGATRVIVAMHRQNNPQVSLHAHQHVAAQSVKQGISFEERKQQLRERIARVACDSGNG